MNDIENKVYKEMSIESKTYASFKHNMESIKSFVDMMSPYINRTQKKKVHSVNEVINKYIIKEDDKNLIKDKDVYEFAKEMQESMISLKHPELFFKGNFILMLSYFEFLLKDLLKCFYLSYPDSLKGGNGSLSYKELLNFNNYDEVLAFIIDKECSNMTYSSFRDQVLDFTSNKLNIKNFTYDNIDSLNEAFQRRNILVHNDSIVNDIYLQKVGSVNKSLKKGDKVTINKRYFDKVYRELLLLGNILQLIVLNKVKSENERLIDNLTIDFSYDLLSNNDNDSLICYFKHINGLKIYSTKTKIYLTLNYLIAEKNKKTKDIDILIEELISDWEVCESIIKTAVYALKGDKEMVKSEIVKTDLNKEVWLEWPLFKDLRKSVKYKNEILNILPD